MKSLRNPLANVVNIDDLRIRAKRRLPKFVFDFMEGGAEGEFAVRRNRDAFHRLRLVPRTLVNVIDRDMSCMLFGRRYAAPIGICPTGLSSVVWPGGDIARAQAAAALDVPFIYPMLSSETIEEIGPLAPARLWFQLYPLRDWAIMEDLLSRARAAGMETLVVTVDVPVSSKRERDRRNKFVVPFRFTPSIIAAIAAHPAWALANLRARTPGMPNMTPYAHASGISGQASFIAELSRVATDWSTIERLRALWKGPLVLKGIMAGDDVHKAVAAGVDGVILSNHGGRQLDAAPASIEMVAQIVDAAQGRLTVMLDSGIMRGADVLRAIAQGAACGFIGRASLYGLAAEGGRAGVEHALRILIEEMDLVMGQMGCPTLSAFDRHHVMATDWV